MPDDADLLRRYAADRDQLAFAELVARHLDFVYRTALRQLHGDTHSAEDVCQEVFVILAKKASAVAKRPILVAWLHTATRYSVTHHVRSEQRRRERERKASQMSELDANESATDWSHLRPVIDDALAQLDDRDRSAVLLRFFNHCTFAELGTKLGLSEDGARTRVDRALAKLNTLLAPHGLTTTAEAIALACAAESVIAAPPTLASAVVTTATAVHFGATSSLLVMTATHLKIVSAGAILAACGIALFLQHRNAQIEITALQNRIADLKATDRRTKALPRATPATPDASLPRPAVAPIASPLDTASEPTVSEMMKDPAFAALWRKEKLRQINRVMGPQLAKLNLPPEQQAKLMDLLFERTEAERVGREAARHTGMTDGESNKAAAMANDSVYAEIKTLLGDETYRQFDAALQMSRVNLAIEDQFGQDLTAAGAPLSAEQSAALAQIHTALKLPLNPAHQEPADPATGLTPQNKSFLAQAADVLSPAQLSIVRQRFVDQNERIDYLRAHPKAPLPGK